MKDNKWLNLSQTELQESNKLLPPLCVFLAPPSGDDWRKVRCGVLEVHSVRHADARLCLGFNLYLHRERFSLSLSLSPSLPCNYAAAESLSGRRGSTSGWSRHFLAASSTSTIWDPHLAVISALPQQTNPLPVSNPRLSKIICWIISSVSLLTVQLCAHFCCLSYKRNYSPSLFAVCGCQRCWCRFFTFLFVEIQFPGLKTLFSLDWTTLHIFSTLAM